MALARVGLVFDGDDLVVYGAVVMTLLRDASQTGPVHPATAGALGGCALGSCAVDGLAVGLRSEQHLARYLLPRRRAHAGRCLPGAPGRARPPLQGQPGTLARIAAIDAACLRPDVVRLAAPALQPDAA